MVFSITLGSLAMEILLSVYHHILPTETLNVGTTSGSLYQGR